MTCTRTIHTLRVIALSFGVFIVLVVLAALAQTRGEGEPSGKSFVIPPSSNASGVLLSVARAVLPGGEGLERSRAPRSQGDRLGADPMGPGGTFFLPAVNYDPQGQGIEDDSVAVADVNGDGVPDLLVANGSACPECPGGSIAVLMGNGDGTFRSAVTYDAGGLRPTSIAVDDLNGDGKPDLVTGNGDFTAIGVLLGNGDGTFQPVAGYDTLINARRIVVRDVNGDGKPDVLVLSFCDGPHCGNFASDGAATVLLGNGDGSFRHTLKFYDSGGREANALAVADLNGDGKPDVVVANQSGIVSVLLGNGDGTFQPATNYAGVNPSNVAIADVNGDGKPDILEVDLGSGAGVLLGNGDGTFQPRVGYSTGGYTGKSLVLADVSRDGELDVVVANSNSGTVAVLPGNGDGTFEPAVTQAASNPRSMAVADLNADGRLDLVVGTSDGNVNRLVGVMLHVGVVPTTTTVTSSVNPSVFGQSATFTAKVSAASGTPKGTVLFFDGSTSLGSATLVNGSGSISTSALEAGSRSIIAVYQGSLKFNSGSSALFQQVVNPATTTSSLASSQNPAVITELVTYTATIGSQYGGAVAGTVVFQDGGTKVGTVTLAGNQAAYTTKYSTPGAPSITATYSGDTNNIGSVSPALVEQINKGFPSMTVLTTSGSPSFVGQPVTFTATVSSTHGSIPDGELVTFYDGTTVIGTGTTSSGVATFSTSSLTAKTHTIKATYAGDAIFRPSTGAVTQVVNGYPTTTTLTSSPNPSHSGQKVTFTATVTSSGPTPTGTVKFMDGTTKLGAATLSGGVAKLTKSLFAVGTHPITAQYIGDAFSVKSTSLVGNQVVQ